MKFEELIIEVKQAVFEIIRVDSADYFEAVTLTNRIANLSLQLNKFFGAPAWPSKTPLTPEMKNAVKEFGGIMADQTLFFWNEGKQTVLVMFWPWRDGIHTTVKAASLNSN